MIEHHMAGDLIMPTGTMRARAGSHASQSGLASPTKDLRRRNMLRHSIGSAVPPSPAKTSVLPPGGRGGSPAKKSVLPPPPHVAVSDDGKASARYLHVPLGVGGRSFGWAFFWGRAGE